jgi:membrane-associated protease RseP (regulator of RpoE activity)
MRSALFFVIAMIPFEVLAGTSLDEITIGVYCLPVSGEIGIDGIEEFSWPTEHGAVVSGVATKSPALDAGIRRFDVIVRFNGRKIGGPDDIAPALVGHPLKKKVVALVFRPEYSGSHGGGRIKWKRKTLRIEPVTLQTSSHASACKWSSHSATFPKARRRTR